MPKCQDRDESRVGGWGTNGGEHEVNGNGQNHHRDGPWDSNRGVVQPRFPLLPPYCPSFVRRYALHAWHQECSGSRLNA